MAWDTGTIISATPWAALSTKIQATFNLDTTGGRSPTRNWSFVETIPAGTGTGQSGSASYSVDVFKCAGSGTDANDAGVDFYVGMPQGGSTTFPTNWICAELYSPTSAGSNKAMFARPTPVGGATAPSAAPNYTFTESYATANAVSKLAVGFANVILPTTGFVYYIKTTKNFLIVTVKYGTAALYIYFGLMDSLCTITDAMPLVQAGGSWVSSANASFSRLPGVTATPPASLGWTASWEMWGPPGHVSWSSNGQTTSPGIGNPTDVNSTDIWLGGKFPVGRGVLIHNNTSPSTLGWFRGLFKSDVLFAANRGNSSSFPVMYGDTVTIGGTTYYVVGGAGNTQSTGSSGSGFNGQGTTYINYAWLVTAT